MDIGASFASLCGRLNDTSSKEEISLLQVHQIISRYKCDEQDFIVYEIGRCLSS